MSILKPIPDAEIFRDYTHSGWVGLCPVYIHEPSGDLIEQNGIPTLWLVVNGALADAVNDVRPLLGLPRWPSWPVLIGRRIGAGARR